MRAAWKLDAKAGMAKLEKLAQWLERELPDEQIPCVKGWRDTSPSIKSMCPLPCIAAGQHQPDGKPSFRSSSADAPRLPLAGPTDGDAVARRRYVH
jgi:hypothetical protein